MAYCIFSARTHGKMLGKNNCYGFYKECSQFKGTVGTLCQLINYRLLYESNGSRHRRTTGGGKGEVPPLNLSGRKPPP